MGKTNLTKEFPAERIFTGLEREDYSKSGR